jgi:hypothetical protein
MNVLWVEDFGGGLKADSATVINLFRGLIPVRVFDDEWGPETDLLSDPGELSRFFLTHSPQHRVDLMRHYADFQAAQIDFNTEYDAVAIDINLSRGLPRDTRLPTGHADAEAFHKKAGFYIYNQLIQNGFPAEHICFLTGEKESTFGEFAQHCHQALMPLPAAFGKDDAGLEELRGWLGDRLRCTYTILRRGVIEGCRMVRPTLEGQADAIQFNAFLENGKATPIAMDDYLSALATFLSLRKPDAKNELERTLRLFVRAIAHEWESNAKPSNIRPNGDKHLSALRAFGQVMKNTRNWLAHSVSLNHLTVQTAAYLFLINLRAMFRISPEIQHHEHILLAAFGSPISGLNKETLSTQLTENYRALVQALKPVGADKLAWRFNDIANNLENIGVTGIDYVQALYQILWHQLAQRENRDLAMVYKCDARPSSFATSERSDDFLSLLLRHLYSHSFRVR